jgi:3-hexulose-6-phosphate synthase
MRLQLAIDAPEHFALIPRLARYVDIVEVGTPVLKRFGLSAISTALELSGGKPVLADTKTADGGRLEAEMVFQAGASMMTVLAPASDATRRSTVDVAGRFNGIVIFDTILDGAFDVTQLAEPVGGAEQWVALHASSDMRRAGVETDAHIVAVTARHAQGLRVSLAGGIRRDNLAKVLEVAPDVIVIGSGITESADPEGEAAWIRAQIDSARG